MCRSMAGEPVGTTLGFLCHSVKLLWTVASDVLEEVIYVMGMVSRGVGKEVEICVGQTTSF